MSSENLDPQVVRYSSRRSRREMRAGAMGENLHAGASQPQTQLVREQIPVEITAEPLRPQAAPGEGVLAEGGLVEGHLAEGRRLGRRAARTTQNMAAAVSAPVPDPPPAPAATSIPVADQSPAGSDQAAAYLEVAAHPEEEKKRKHRSVSVLVMSGLGQTMLSAGVVLALFVVWQLYVTSWQVQGATAAAVETFTQTTAKEASEITEIQRTDAPPEVALPGVGQTFATLHVPRWDSMVIPVMEGTTKAVLDTGYAGHYTRTQGPGQIGNFAIAAHRRSYGNSFRRVQELQIGDPLVVETTQAWLIYQVIDTEIVLPANGEVINAVPHQPDGTVAAQRLMTMTTCHPEYGNTERFIVYSRLAYWVPRSAGRPLALQGLDAMTAKGHPVPAPTPIEQIPYGADALASLTGLANEQTTTQSAPDGAEQQRAG